MKLQTPLHGGNIVLRTMCPEDASLVYLGWLKNPEINAYLEVRFSIPQSTSDLKSFIAKINESSDSIFLGIFLKENGRHIGNIKLGPIDWHHQVGDVGFLIGDKEQWGKGLASMAISMLTNYAFTNLNLAKLTAGCYSGNEGSRRALQKAGFLEEGRLVSQWLVRGFRQDGLIFGCINPNISL